MDLNQVKIRYLTLCYYYVLSYVSGFGKVILKRVPGIDQLCEKEKHDV